MTYGVWYGAFYLKVGIFSCLMNLMGVTKSESDGEMLAKKIIRQIKRLM